MSARVIWWRVTFKLENVCNFDVVLKFRYQADDDFDRYAAWREALRLEASHCAVALKIVSPDERSVLVSRAWMTAQVAFPVVAS